MNFTNRRLAVLALAICFTQPGFATEAAQPGKWVTTWSSSAHATWGKEIILPTQVPTYLDNQSMRDDIRITTGGRQIRVRYSNRYGKEPITIGAARLAVLTQSQNTGPNRHPLTFSGQRHVVVPPGATALSDPLKLAVAPLAQLQISTYFPKRTRISTFHWGETQTGLIGAGNMTAAAKFDTGEVLKGRAFLEAVLVESDAHAQTVVALGDSITDGVGSTPNQNRRWTDYLANRLAERGIAVANAGIPGARLLQDGMGSSALARLEHDVLGQPGIASVIVLLGTNDIGWPGSPFAPDSPPTRIEDLVSGYLQLISAARVRNVRVIGATVPPMEGALRGTPFEGHYSTEKDRLRQAFNTWIRTSGAFDSVVDFDAILRDPSRPSRLLPALDSGDHLHPGDAGYQRMADAITEAMLFGEVPTASAPTKKYRN